MSRISLFLHENVSIDEDIADETYVCMEACIPLPCIHACSVGILCICCHVPNASFLAGQLLLCARNTLYDMSDFFFHPRLQGRKVRACISNLRHHTEYAFVPPSTRIFAYKERMCDSKLHLKLMHGCICNMAQFM